jgi:hypothetical protein
MYTIISYIDRFESGIAALLLAVVVILFSNVLFSLRRKLLSFDYFFDIVNVVIQSNADNLHQLQF